MNRVHTYIHTDIDIRKWNTKHIQVDQNRVDENFTKVSDGVFIHKNYDDMYFNK